MTNNLMDIKALAEYLGMNKMTVYKLAREGVIPAFKVASEWRFRRDLIDAWLMRQVKYTPPAMPRKRKRQPQGEKSGLSSVLVVDDEPLIRELFSRCLADYEVRTAKSGEEAIEQVLHQRPNLVLLDFRMPGIDGIETLKRIKEIDPRIVVIMLSAFMTPDQDLMAVRLGAYTSLCKPFDPEDICLMISQALKDAAQKTSS